MAATGVKTFSSGGVAVSKFSNEPLEPGDYEGMIRASKWEERKAEGNGKLPYLNGPIEILNTGIDGGKNRLLYHMLWTCAVAKPGKATAAIALQDQLIALARAMGEELQGVALISGVQQELDEKTHAMRQTDILAPKAVLQWLKNHDGIVFKLRIRTEKGTGGYADKSKVDQFTEGEAAEGGVAYEPEGEAAVEYDASTGEVYDTEAQPGTEAEYQTEELPEEEPQFEPIPPPRRAAAVNPGPRVQQGPIKNGKVIGRPAPKASTPAPRGRPVTKQARR